MGKEQHQKDGCQVIRVIMKNDVTTRHGLQMVMEAVKQPKCLLWAAMPCTGGSPWQNINRVQPGGEENLLKTRQVFQEFWTSFLTQQNMSRSRR
eukprot:5961141-Heterocapsa_arctica.AAC.1